MLVNVIKVLHYIHTNKFFCVTKKAKHSEFVFFYCRFIEPITKQRSLLACYVLGLFFTTETAQNNVKRCL